MHNGGSYIRNSNDFTNEITSFKNVPINLILVTAAVLGSYPGIPHDSGLNAIKGALDNRERKSILTRDILKLLELVLKINYFESNGKVLDNKYFESNGKVLDKAIRTKSAPQCACIFIDKVETTFFESQKHKPIVWFCHTDNIFFISTHGENELKQLFKSIKI